MTRLCPYLNGRQMVGGSGDPERRYTMQFKLIFETQTDQRPYNLPEIEKIAAIIFEKNNKYQYRDIRLANRAERPDSFTRIDQNHSSYMLLMTQTFKCWKFS